MTITGRPITFYVTLEDRRMVGDYARLLQIGLADAIRQFVHQFMPSALAELLKTESERSDNLRKLTDARPPADLSVT
jgi:hypothetical protein